MPPALASRAAARVGTGGSAETAEGFAVEDGVVVHDERAVGRAAHVELHAVRAQREREAEGLGGVLRSGARRAAVSQHKRASHGPRLVTDRIRGYP